MAKIQRKRHRHNSYEQKVVRKNELLFLADDYLPRKNIRFFESADTIYPPCAHPAMEREEEQNATVYCVCPGTEAITLECS